MEAATEKPAMSITSGMAWLTPCAPAVAVEIDCHMIEGFFRTKYEINDAIVELGVESPPT